MKDALGPLFRPETVAVVGASDDADKYGHKVFRNIVDGGFGGRLYPVNPNADTVLGRRCYPSLSAVPERLDIVFIVIPARLVVDAVREALAAHARSLVIITAGFGETGEAGRRAEAEIRERCLRAGVPAVGPNCMGICSFPYRLAGTMEALKSEPGTVSFISQSGTYGITTLNYGVRTGVSFNAFVSSGNEAVTRFSDYLEYLGDDPSTQVIMGYIESLRDGVRFMRVARDVTLRKPVVAMKFGRTEKGSLAASSHTGALAGSHAVYSSAFRQAGVVEVTRTQDLLNVAMAFSMQPPLRGRRIASIGASGGFAVAVTDYLEEHNLEVPSFSEELQQRLRREAGTTPYASVRNPVDLAADLRPAPLLTCARIAIEQDFIDGLIAALPSRPYPPAEETIREIERLHESTGKPVLICYYARPEGVDVVQRMTKRIPVYGNAEAVGEVMSALRQYGDYLSRNGVTLPRKPSAAST
jgi:acyl-CoA synthetase (NDP forming)